MERAIRWDDLELIKTLGEGHAGIVHLAKLKKPFKELPSGSLVAIKHYKNWVLEEPGQFERIIRELEVGRRVKHKSLVETLSVIMDQNRKPALVMTYYEGETLENFLKKSRDENREIDVAYAFEIIGSLAAALHELHTAGAIHRDVKPANVILSKSGRPILMDLGVVASSNFPEQTHTGSFLGTIRYGAPEYLFGEEYDWRIDVFGLGTIAYELFAKHAFLESETHWARLIVMKRQKTKLPFDYKALQNRAGVNAAEFVAFILDKALARAEKRGIDLRAFSELVNKRAWEKPFYVVESNIFEGEPRVKSLGVWEPDAPDVPLKEVVHDLKKQLTGNELNALKKFLDNYYWEVYTPVSHYSTSYLDYLKMYEQIGAIQLDTGYSRFYVIIIHDSVKAAYRYGYL